jgi:hypothetical protein
MLKIKNYVKSKHVVRNTKVKVKFAASIVMNIHANTFRMSWLYIGKSVQVYAPVAVTQI